MKNTKFFSATQKSANNNNNSTDVLTISFDHISDIDWYNILLALAKIDPITAVKSSLLCKRWHTLVNFKESKELSIKERAFFKVLNNKSSLLKRLDPAIDEYLEEIHQGILKEKTDFSEIATTFDCLLAESLKIKFEAPEGYQKPSNFDDLAKIIKDSKLPSNFKSCSKKDRQRIVSLMEIGFHSFSLLKNDALDDKKQFLIKNAYSNISNEEIIPYKDQRCFKIKGHIYHQYRKGSSFLLIPALIGLLFIILSFPNVAALKEYPKEIKTDIRITGIVLLGFTLAIALLDKANRWRNRVNEENQHYQLSEFFLKEIVVDNSSSEQSTNNLQQLTNS